MMSLVQTERGKEKNWDIKMNKLASKETIPYMSLY